MSMGVWLASLVRERLASPFDFSGSIHLRTVNRDFTFEDGLSVDGRRLVGILVGRRLVESWSLGSRAVLLDGRTGEILLTTEIISFRKRDEEVPVSGEVLRTNAAIPVAKLLREEQKKRVRPPTYTSPDLGSSTRVDLSLLEAHLRKVSGDR